MAKKHRRNPRDHPLARAVANRQLPCRILIGTQSGSQLRYAIYSRKELRAELEYVRYLAGLLKIPLRASAITVLPW